MARKPRVQKPEKERAAKVKRRTPGALAVVVFLLLAGTAGLAAWLTYSYEEPVHPGQRAAAGAAVLPIDLSKDGHGEQAPPKMASKAVAKSDAGDGGHAKAVPPRAVPPRAAPSRPAPSRTETQKPAEAAARQEASQAPKAQKETQPRPAPRVEDPPRQSDGQKSAKSSAAAPAPETKAGPDAKPSKPTKPSKPRGSFTRSGGLRPAPDPALVKTTDDGPLPVVAPDGRTPLQVYARPYKATGRPRIAVVVGGLGMSQATTLAAIQQLPGGVTLAFAPYGRILQDYVNQARAAGHEVLLQVPMEPMDYPTNDPGPHTLLTSLTINRNLKRLDWLLGRFTGYVGVVNFMGGRFTSAQSHLAPMLEAMRGRGLMFLDSRASSASVAVQVAGQIGLDIAASDRVVDAIASRAAIDARLLELERLAAASGGAIGIGFPYPVTIERLAQWTRAMGDRGFDLVPVSALTGQRKANP